MVLLQELRKPWKDTLSLSPLIEAEAEILLALSQNVQGEGTELQESHFSPLAPGGREPERGGTNDAKR